MAKKYLKTFGERPEEVMVLQTKVFFDADGIAIVEDDEVAEVLEAVPGYEFVSSDSEEGEVEKTPVDPPGQPEGGNEHPGVKDPENTDEGTQLEETFEEDEEDSEEENTSEEGEEVASPKPIKAPSRVRKPSTPKK